MLRKILQPMDKELSSVHQLIRNELTIKAGYVGSFAHLEFSFNNKNIRPALVLLSTRMYGGDLKKAVDLASVIQFIYMASKIHQEINEKDSDYIRGDSDPRDGSQFPVLVGDYLYGKFFTFLSDAGMINLLHPLAEIICLIHEGGIIKKKLTGQGLPLNSKTFLEVVRKETAELFAGCCVLGTRLAGAPEKEQEYLKKFGQNLGMAYGLLEQDAPLADVASYIDEALGSLALLPDLPERALLEQLVLNVSGFGLPVQQRMVI